MPKDTVAIAMEEWLSLGNVLKAEQLLLAAENMGNGLAAYNLGTLYVVGGQGVEANAVKSMFWYEKALESGFGLKLPMILSGSGNNELNNADSKA